MIIALALFTAPLTACGRRQEAANPAPGSEQRPLVAKLIDDPSEESSAPSATSSDANLRPALPSHKAAGAGGANPDRADSHTTPARRAGQRFSPCDLVTASEAREIVGEPMRKPLEASQGPTCIYRAQAGTTLVAVALQKTNFERLKPQLRDPRQMTLLGRAASCGTYGRPGLYVPLARGRLLSVSGSCAVARDFALKALSRL